MKIEAQKKMDTQACAVDLIKGTTTSISFEFFPPKTEESAERLYNSIEELVPLEPTFVSVTYGAGGTTRKLTRELVIRIRRKTGLTVVPHLTSVGSSKDEIAEIVGSYYDEGIRNVLALRGDPPKDAPEDFSFEDAAFPYAQDLVRFIKREFPKMCVGGACYPEGHKETPNRLTELEFLKEKVDAGTDWMVSQMFFDNQEYYDFVARCRLAGIDVPILAGIMPVSTRKGMQKMAELSPGTRFPAGLLKAVDRVTDDSQVRNVGNFWATGQVHELLENEVDGIQFYTLNRSKPTLEIYKSLGLSEPEKSKVV